MLLRGGTLFARSFSRSCARCLCTLDIEAQISLKMQSTDQGTVVGLSGDVARVAGLDGVAVGAVVDINGTHGLVVNLETQAAAVALMSTPSTVNVGASVVVSSSQHTFHCGEDMLGRVVGVDGSPIEGIDSNPSNPVRGEQDVPVMRPAAARFLIGPAGSSTRESLPLHTGIALVDAFHPIWHGQRLALLGPVAEVNTDLALDIMCNVSSDAYGCSEASNSVVQPVQPHVVVYASIGKSEQHLRRVTRRLADAGVQNRTAIVAAPNSVSNTLQWLCPFAACALAENLRDSGHSVLLVYDGLTEHADSWALLAPELWRTSRSDSRSLHADLLERSTSAGSVCSRARDSSGQGPATLTALALAHTVAADESEMRSSSDETVGEALISICDRHIFLDGHHASQGLNPPVNILCGAPRGDGRGQLPAIAKLVIGLREQLVAGTAADENAKLAVSLGLDPEEEMQRHLFNNGRLQAVFNRQQQGTHMSLRELWLSLALSTGEVPRFELASEAVLEAPSNRASLKARAAAARRASRGGTPFHEHLLASKSARVQEICHAFSQAFVAHVREEQPELWNGIGDMLALHVSADAKLITISASDEDMLQQNEVLQEQVHCLAEQFYRVWETQAIEK